MLVFVRIEHAVHSCDELVMWQLRELNVFACASGSQTTRGSEAQLASPSGLLTLLAVMGEHRQPEAKGPGAERQKSLSAAPFGSEPVARRSGAAGLVFRGRFDSIASIF